MVALASGEENRCVRNLGGRLGQDLVIKWVGDENEGGRSQG